MSSEEQILEILGQIKSDMDRQFGEVGKQIAKVKEDVSVLHGSVIKLEALPHEMSLVADKVQMSNEKMDELLSQSQKIDEYGDRLFAVEETLRSRKSG